MPDTTLITALILDRPMCLACVSTKSGRSLAEVETAIAVIQTSLVLLLDEERR